MYYHTKYPQANCKQENPHKQYTLTMCIDTSKLLRCVASAEEGEVHDGWVVGVEFFAFLGKFEDGSHVGRGAGKESVLTGYSIDMHVERYK